MKTTFFIFFLLTTNTFGQVSYLGERSNQGRWGVITNDNSNEVSGSPYLFEEWREGKITFTDNVEKDAKLRYDIYRDVFHILITPKDSFSLIPGHVNEIILKNVSGSTRVFMNIGNRKPANTALITGFYEVMVDDSTSLIAKRAKRIKRHYQSAMETVQGQQKKDELINDDKYFIVKNNNIVEVAKNKNSVEDVLNNQKAAISEYIKAKKLKFRDESDLVEIVKFYNTLN